MMRRLRNTYWLAVRGEQRGFAISLMRGFLTALSALYFLGYKSRELLYRMGLLRGVRLPCKVISVGNLTAGGTGKTPMVLWLARWLGHSAVASPGRRIVILSRGYGKTASKDIDDESLVDIEGVHRFTASNRAALAKQLLKDRTYDAMILDDGFQHFRIQRDLNIVLVDATRPFSNGCLLPRGLLRERPQALKRADVIVITHADQVRSGPLEALRDRLEAIVHHRNFVEALHKPLHVVHLTSKKVNHLRWLKDRKVYAFCGIGNPESFKATLELIGADVVKFRAFPDHHVYTYQEVKQLEAEAGEFMAETLMTTEKDALRMDPFMFDMEIASLKVELEIVRGEAIFEQAVARLFQLKTTHV